MVRVQLVAILAMVQDTVKSQISERYLKVHCRDIQCYFYRFFCCRKWQGGDSRRRPTSLSLGRTFFLHLSKLRDRSTSEQESVGNWPLQSHSSLGRGWIWDIIKKVKPKRQVFPWLMAKNSWNSKQACRAPRIDLEVSWSDAWSDAQFKIRDLSGAVVYISLHSTIYKTIIDRQDICWARFVLKDARPPLFFPRTKI